MQHLGGCLCGAVRYRADGPLRDVIYCHCSQCRKQTGLYYAATAVDQSNLQITDTPHLRWFAASAYAERGFCGTCGSVLFWRPNAASHIAILAGSLDDPTVLKAASHICTEDRPGFYSLNDGLPQYLHASPDLAIDGA